MITQAELEILTGYKRPADIEKCLQAQGLRVFRGKDGRVFLLPQDYQPGENGVNVGGRIEFE